MSERTKLERSRDALLVEIGRALVLLMERTDPPPHPQNVNVLAVALAVFEANVKHEERPAKEVAE